MRIKWLHLSDIHFSYKNYDSRLLRADFIDRIKELCESEHFTHLFLSGDILNKNTLKETDDSETVQFLNELISAMGINTSSVFLVPGNHDHDRDIAKNLLEEAYKAQDDETDRLIDNLSCSTREELLRAFERFNTVYEKVFCVPYYTKLDKPHIIESSSGISIIKLNTAWLDVDSKEGGILRFGHTELLDELEKSKDILKNNLCIALGHHPIESFSDAEQKRLLDLFSRFNIHLYLCGHKHIPSITHIYDSDVIQLVCPGGFIDGYSHGGYIYGVLDTDTDFYKAECYSWKDGSWRIESSLDGTDERGLYYFNSASFRHNSNIVAIDFKLMDARLPRSVISKTLNTDRYDLHVYSTGHLDVTSISNRDWDLHQSLVCDLSATIQHYIGDNKAVHLFPLAPVPLLIDLGYQLQKGSKITIHQYDRKNNSWVQSEKDEGITASIEDEKITGKNKLAVLLSTSAKINDKLVFKSIERSECDVISISASSIGLGSPLYAPDIERIVDFLFDKLMPKASCYESIHLFAAVPAALAIEIGRNLQKTLFSNVFTYHFCNQRYHQAIIINPQKDIEESENTGSDSIVRVPIPTHRKPGVPIVGSIACGEISEAILESDECFPLPESILGHGEHFILVADGDSMIGAGIEDGDYVVIRQQNTAEEGQIVAARVDDQTTLKRYHLDTENKRIILHSENELFADQFFDDVEIQGIAKMVIKSLH